MRIIVPVSLLFVCVGCGDSSGAAPPTADDGGAGNASGGESGAATSGGTLASGGEGGAPLSDNEGGRGGDGGDTSDGGSGGDGLLPDEPDNGTHGGSRLKAEWYDFSGTRVFAHFYDTELETACAVSAWSDGKQYCIPISTAALGFVTDQCEAADMLGHVSFNSACTNAPPGYLVLPAEDSPCGRSSAHVYRLSDTPISANEYFAGQNGACSGPFSNGFNSASYPVTDEVLPSELVELTRAEPADPGRISRQYLVAADGAQLAIAPHDSELDVDCSLTPGLVDREHGSCPPAGVKDIVFYSDSECEQPVVAGTKECDKPGFAQVLVDRMCAQGEKEFYAVGDAVKVASPFVGSATVCRATTVSSGQSLFALGKRVTVQSFTRAHEDVAGQTLQRIYFSDGQKRYLDPQLLYDAEHETECQVNVLADGTVVCVPYGSSVSAFYDETCTSFVRVGLVYFGAEHCEQPKLPPFMTNSGVASNGCGPGYEIRERGELFAGTAYLKGDTCDVYTALEPFHFFEMGPVRPFSEFPTATLVRDE